MSRVALIGDNSVEYVNQLLDIWNNGDCAVLLDWQLPFESMYQMMLEANVTVCYIERRLLEKVNVPEGTPILFRNFDVLTCGSQLLPKITYEKYHENNSCDEAVILYSSGTTGKSKGIILSHFAISINADAILDYMRLNSHDCLYIAKSLSHSSTLTGELLVALKSRTSVVISPTIVPPRYVLNQIEKLNVTTLCINPTLMRMYTDEYCREKYLINSLKTIYVSGSILNDRVYAHAHNTFNNVDIFNVYGLSEAGPRVSAQTTKGSKTNSVGKPIKNVEVAIVDENGKPVPNGERGIIHVNTPSRFLGYVSGTEKHQSLYNNWLNTGDIGFIDEQDELHVVNRVDDMIICNAHKVYPQDVEKIILEIDGISECVVAKCICDGFETIGCLYASDTDHAVSILRNLKKILMPYEIPRHFFRTDTIPLTIRGKVDKREVEKIFEKATLSEN